MNYLEEYLAGKLSGDQLAQFKARLEVDEDLQEAVALHQKIIGGLEAIGENKVREQLQQVEQNYLETKTKEEASRKGAVIRFWRPMVAVAGMALLFFGFFLFRDTGLTSTDNLAEQATSILEVKITKKIKNNGFNARLGAEKKLLQQAMISKNKNALLQARERFEAVVEQKTDTRLYQGYIELELGNIQAAEAHFLWISKEHPEHELQPLALWGLVAIYLKEKDLENAKVYLEELGRIDGQVEKSTEMLESLI